MSLNLLVLGAPASGKSSLLLQYCSDMFLDKHIPTLEDVYRKTVKFEDGRCCLCEILDASGSEQFLFQIPTADAFILVYSITSRDSFSKLQAIRDLITQIKEPSPALMILIGTHSDLSSQREVSTEEGQELSASWNCLFFETSSKLNFNVDIAFSSIILQTLELIKNSDTCRLKEFKKSARSLRKSFSKTEHSTYRKDGSLSKSRSLPSFKSKSKHGSCSIM